MLGVFIGQGPFKAAARELGKYKLDVVGVQEVRWDKGDTVRAGDYDFQEVGCGHVDWIGMAQDRDRWRTLVSAVMNIRVP